jgi:2-dehydro-3-deoxyphosphogluconate aldolase / (4S)-4-hydroxy-2-oxoglutarate aldolase
MLVPAGSMRHRAVVRFYLRAPSWPFSGHRTPSTSSGRRRCCGKPESPATSYTLTTEGALTAFGTARRTLEDVVLGVGSVRTVEHLRAVADAGADFAVSQVFLPELVEAAADLGLCYIPGALTPTEIISAWNCGAPAVKVSPVGPLGGPNYFREIFVPMPDVALMPTGGVTLEGAAEYLQLGAAAVGVSRFLFGDALLTGDVAGLKSRADQLVSSVQLIPAS